MNGRELRIALLYLSFVGLDILSIWYIRVTGFMYLDDSISFATFSGILLAFLILVAIPSISAAIYHIVKSYTFQKKLAGRKCYSHWTLSEEEWFDFIRMMLAVNLKDDAKSILKMSLALIPVASLLTLVYFAQATKKSPGQQMMICLALPFLVCLAYFLWIAGRNSLKFLDHLLFSNKTITLMKDAVLFNEELIVWGTSLENELLRIKIRGGFLVILYTVTARSKGRHSRRIETDIKQLKIPIPKGKTEEARFLTQRM